MNDLQGMIIVMLSSSPVVGDQLAGHFVRLDKMDELCS